MIVKNDAFTGWTADDIAVMSGKDKDEECREAMREWTENHYREVSEDTPEGSRPAAPNESGMSVLSVVQGAIVEQS